MIALNIDRLSLSFGTKVILDGVTFSADETDKIGIIGGNVKPAAKPGNYGSFPPRHPLHP